MRNNSTAAHLCLFKILTKQPLLCVGDYLKNFIITQQEWRPHSELSDWLTVASRSGDEGQIESLDRNIAMTSVCAVVWCLNSVTEVEGKYEGPTCDIVTISSFAVITHPAW